MIYAFALFAVLRIADSAMTYYAVNHGYRELNPLLKWAVGKWWTNILTCVASLVLIWLIVLNLPPVFGWVLIVSGAILQAWVVWHNIRILK